jgi:hypothetical protein
VNLFDPFWQRRADGLYLKGGDDHWNARGQAYAAELVSEFISAHSLLGGPSPDTRAAQGATGQQPSGSAQQGRPIAVQ